MCGVLKLILIRVVRFPKYYVILNYYVIIGGQQLIFQSLYNIEKLWINKFLKIKLVSM